MFLNLTVILLDSQQNVRKLCVKLDFSTKYYFAVLFFKVSAWLSNHAVCKIGLASHYFNCLHSLSLFLFRVLSLTILERLYVSDMTSTVLLECNCPRQVKTAMPEQVHAFFVFDKKTVIYRHAFLS